jgi:hypothetical protein
MALELPKFGKKGEGSVSIKAKPDIALKITNFFDKNPLMKVIIPVILFIILVAVILFIILGDNILLMDNAELPEDVTANSNQVEVIPGNNVIKDKVIVDLIDADPLSPDILASAKYTGYVTGSSGLKTALIQIGSQNDNLILSLGETVGDSDWELIEITKDYVVFKAGETTKKISIS